MFKNETNNVFLQITGRPTEAGDLYLIQSGREAHGECRYFRLKSFR